MGVVKCTGIANTSVYLNRPIKWIFIHYTAGTNSSGGVAKNIARMFANPKTQASADFIVDDKTIVQYNPDIQNRYTWAVGGEKYSSMSTSEGGKYYAVSNNSNSISVEMCSRKIDTKSLRATDTDWYFTDEVEDLTVELVKSLMKKYGIDSKHVIMHHHRTGKICPNPYCVNEGRLKRYYEFIARLEEGECNAKIIKGCTFYKSQNNWQGEYCKLSTSTKIKVIKDIGNGWSRVEYANSKGYVKNSCIRMNNGDILSKYPIRKATKKVALRKERNKKPSSKVGSITKGTKFELRGKDNKWAQIKYKGKLYYVWKARTTVK